MSDITRDDLRICQVHGYQMWTDNECMERFVTDPNDPAGDIGSCRPAPMLRAIFTDECECEDGLIWQEVPCDEHDHDPPLPANTSCTMLMKKQVRHADCAGRGWLPKDGVRIFENDETLVGGRWLAFWFDWLEADDE